MDESNSLLSPPSWSLAVGDFGRYAILLSAILSLSSVIGWALLPRFPKISKLAGVSLNLGVCGLFGSFVALGALFVASRFEYSYVFQHGEAANALQYRIAGIWSGQQGSFLLWACASGLFALLTVRGTGPFRRWYSIAYGVFQAGLSGILVFESPFQLNQVDGRTIVPTQGAGLAPSLLNYWVTIHPPTIFLGFGALTVLFAYAFAALMENDFKSWLPRVRPWALVALAVLGLGLCMGGFWAYETLGWGGFWMWDPVENVSFVPWCLTVAFVHGIIVQTARGTKKMPNILMAGLPFLTFIYGTFLTRSGFLSDASVHSFAEMNRTALKLLLGLMAISYGGFFGALGFRSYQARKQRPAVVQPVPAESPYGRQNLISIGIATVYAIGLATMIGMSIPFVQALRHQPSKVVEEGLYHQVLTWFFVPTIVLTAVAPFAPWRNGTRKELVQKAYAIFCIAVGFTGLFMIGLVFTPFGNVINRSPLVTLVGKHDLPGMTWLLFLVGVCSFSVIGNLWRIWELRKQSRLGWSPFLAHIGVAVLMFGLIISRGFEQKGQLVVMKDHPAKALGYEFRYRKMTSTDRDHNNHVVFDVYSVDHPETLLFTAAPGMYKVPMEDGNMNTMVWPAIVHRPLYDVYISLRPPQEQVSEPVPLKEGETTQFGGLVVTYEKLAIHGEPGMAGTSFAANLKVSAGSITKSVSPSMELGGNGPVQHSVALDDNMNVAVTSFNAADHSVNLQFQLATPMFPIDVYHKPMTLFVWFGTGLMTLAGLLSAVYRRVPSTTKAAEAIAVPAGNNPRRLVKQNS